MGILGGGMHFVLCILIKVGRVFIQIKTHVYKITAVEYWVLCGRRICFTHAKHCWWHGVEMQDDIWRDQVNKSAGSQRHVWTTTPIVSPFKHLLVVIHSARAKL